jgi:hypothetical protein
MYSAQGIFQHHFQYKKVHVYLIKYSNISYCKLKNLPKMSLILNLDEWEANSELFSPLNNKLERLPLLKRPESDRNVSLTLNPHYNASPSTIVNEFHDQAREQSSI